MPSFDMVSEVDKQELDNAVNGVVREITNRYDFKGSSASIELEDEGQITIAADNDYQVQTMGDMLKSNAIKRSIDAKAFDFGVIEDASGATKRQKVTVKQGVPQEVGKQVNKAIKDSKMKVQASIRGEEMRVTGKKRDDLQAAMQLIRELNLDIPVQFSNFRD